jgi:Ala-tRNA(Pro) deacylase
MPFSRVDLFAFLDRLGIAHRTVEHPPLFTVEESQALRGSIPGGHVKNLFVKDKKSRVFLITCREDARLDLKRVHEAIGASGRLSFCSGEQLEAMWGVKPGSVTPLGAINDPQHQVTMVLEKALMALDLINLHPLENTATTAISAVDLMKFLAATGHQPLIVDLPLSGT